MPANWQRQLWLCTGIVCRYWPDVYLPANMQCSNMVPFSNIGPTCTGQLIFNTTSGSNMVLLSDIGPTCTCQLIFSTAIGSNMVLFFDMGPTCTCQLIFSTTSGSNMVLFSDIGPTCTCQVIFSTTSDSNMGLASNVLPQLRIRWFRIQNRHTIFIQVLSLNQNYIVGYRPVCQYVSNKSSTMNNFGMASDVSSQLKFS